MKAVVKTGPREGDLEFGDWPEPFPVADQVKIRIAAAGICGTDIHIIKGEWPCKPPVVLGHEFCGTIAEVGPQVKNFKPGDRVVASNPAITCGECFHCRAGNPFMCAHRVSVGYMIDGAFADYLCISSERCHALPKNVSFREAALGEPLSVAVHAVLERTTVRAGDVVLVSGPGCVGLLTMQVAKLAGARVVVAGIDKDERRLACAQQLGADKTVNASREDLVGVIQGLTDGEGAAVVYECAGAVGSLDICWEAVRKEGTLVPLGIFAGRIQTDFNKVTMKELRVIGSYGYVWTSWQRCIQLLGEKSIKTDMLITHEFPLHEYDKAFRACEDSSSTKVIFKPEMT